jgi:alpha-L-fucosidase
VLDGITAWMQTNGEGIYETRPWKIYGEGPHSVKAGAFQGNSISQLGAKDIRFTRNKANNVVYAHVLGWPVEPVTIQALGSSAQTAPGKVAKVELLGTGKTITWKQANDALTMEVPRDYQPPVDYAAVFKITIG